MEGKREDLFSYLVGESRDVMARKVELLRRSQVIQEYRPKRKFFRFCYCIFTEREREREKKD